MASGEPSLTEPFKFNYARATLGSTLNSNLSTLKSLLSGRNQESLTISDTGKSALNDGDAVNKIAYVTNKDDNESAVYYLQGGGNAVTLLEQSVRDSELEATQTQDVGSVSAQTTNTFTISVSGAETGDPVSVSPPSGINTSLIVSAFVSSSGTVTVQVTNATSGAIDPASGDYTVKVFDQTTAFTTTEDNDTTTNVYWDSGNTRYEINNETGGGKTYEITYEGV